MCLAIFKPVGVSLPIDKELWSDWMSQHPHGSGYMYIHKMGKSSKVVGRRGIFTFDQMVKSLKNDRLVSGDLVKPEVMVSLHFRYRAVGVVGLLNCNPFPIPLPSGWLGTEERWEGIAGVAHNGVVPGWGDDTLSDTHVLAKYLLPGLPLNDDGVAALNRVFEGSRVAILHATREPILIGDWVEDLGIFYSNHTYLGEFWWMDNWYESEYNAGYKGRSWNRDALPTAASTVTFDYRQQGAFCLRNCQKCWYYQCKSYGQHCVSEAYLNIRD